MIDAVTGVILAGGKSTRMGRDKALLPFRGKPLIYTVMEIMQSIFARVVLSDRAESSLPDLPVERVNDRYPEKGPLGGITSVLESGEDRIFCVACDMPFINPDLVVYLCEVPAFDAVVPAWQGRLQVLHAVYSGSLLPAFAAGIKDNRLRISDAFGNARIHYVPDDEIIKFDPEGLSFHNLNTPEDYSRLRE